MAAVGVKAKRQAPTRRWQRGRGGGTDRAPVQSTRGAGLLLLLRSHGVYAWSRDHRRQSCAVFLATDGSTVTPLRQRPAARPSQGRPPGVPHRDLLSPRAHEGCGPRVACVALDRIAPEEGPSATDTDRLLG